MHILVIDGQGGNLGRQLCRVLREAVPQAHITAVGTNSIATANMLKSGADDAATGENAVIVSCRKADVITGPIGIVIADALLGEVTPSMALAVGQSGATRVLIPMNRCDTIIAGIGSLSTASVLADAVEKIRALCKE